MSHNALDTALIDLAAASTALERSAHPTIKDVEESRDKSKRAFKILDAAHMLMSVGIYSVTDAPPDPGPALFPPEPTGPSVPISDPESVTLSALEMLTDWEGLSEEEKGKQFTAQLGALSGLYREAQPLDAEPLDLIPWLEEYNINPLRAFQWVLFAIEKKNFAEFYDGEVLDVWIASLLPINVVPLHPDLVLFDALDDQSKLDLFDSRLNNLADRLAIAAGKPDLGVDFGPWNLAWQLDHRDAFIRMLVAESRCKLSFDVPDDAERDAEPICSIDLETSFNEKLLALEETGVTEGGLKRRAWKKAEAAWRAAFVADPINTLMALTQVLDQSVISWDVPDAEVVE